MFPFKLHLLLSAFSVLPAISSPTFPNTTTSQPSSSTSCISTTITVSEAVDPNNGHTSTIWETSLVLSIVTTTITLPEEGPTSSQRTLPTKSDASESKGKILAPAVKRASTVTTNRASTGDILTLPTPGDFSKTLSASPASPSPSDCRVIISTTNIATVVIEKLTRALTMTSTSTLFASFPKATQAHSQATKDTQVASSLPAAGTTVPFPSSKQSQLPPPSPTSPSTPAGEAANPPATTAPPPLPIGTFIPHPQPSNPSSPQPLNPNSPSPPSPPSPPVALQLPNGDTLLPGSSTTLSNHIISLPTPLTSIQIDNKFYPLPAANPQPQSAPSSPAPQTPNPNPSSLTTFKISAAPAPLSQLPGVLFGAAAAGGGGGASAGPNADLTITLPDGQTIRLNPSSSSSTTPTTHIYNGHTLVFSLRQTPGANTPGVLELAIDGSPVSSFLPVLAQRLVAGAAGQGSDAAFAFDSVIGGVVTLPGGEVLLVSSGSSSSGQGSLAGSSGSGGGGSSGGYADAFGAGDAVVSIQNGTVVVVAGGGGGAGNGSPTTTTTTLLPLSAAGVASATTGRSEVLRVPSSTSTSSLGSTLTSSAAERETSRANEAVDSGAGREMGIGCANGGFVRCVGVVVLTWGIGLELL